MRCKHASHTRIHRAQLLTYRGACAQCRAVCTPSAGDLARVVIRHAQTEARGSSLTMLPVVWRRMLSYMHSTQRARVSGGPDCTARALLPRGVSAQRIVCRPKHPLTECPPCCTYLRMDHFTAGAVWAVRSLTLGLGGDRGLLRAQELIRT